MGNDIKSACMGVIPPSSFWCPLGVWGGFFIIQMLLIE